MGILIRSKWRKKFKSLEEYYDKNFDPKYYDFFALTWDPQTNNQLRSWIIKYRFVEPMDPPKSIEK